MTESNIFESRTAGYDSAGGFCDPVLLKTTSLARLYRVSKAGKYFIIKTTKDNSGTELAMLRREYELSIGCDHPHIIHIYTFEEDTPVGAGIVMEYVEGRTMTEWLAENPTRDSRRRIFGELLAAVGYMHKRGVLHNDLKPDNILISRSDDTLKIIDFGLSDNDAHYLARTLGCTPRYASPELRKQEVLDARSDIYSVGVIMGELFGRSAGRIAARCTHPNREKRFADIGQLQRAWNNRHRPLRIVAVVAAAMMIVLPTALFVREYRHRTAIENAAAQRNAEKNRIIRQVETEAANFGRIAADSISACRYRPFAVQHIDRYNKSMWQLNESLSDIDDADMRAAAHSCYMWLLESGMSRIAAIIDSLPNYPSDMSFDEQRFYDSLAIEGSPYRPYRSNR